MTNGSLSRHWREIVSAPGCAARIPCRLRATYSDANITTVEPASAFGNAGISMARHAALVGTAIRHEADPAAGRCAI